MKSKPLNPDSKTLAYITGLALGDGNLSNPNGRATRLRITCDLKYPKLIDHIQTSIKRVLPYSSVFKSGHKGCIDVNSYSNHWEGILEWKAKMGTKQSQSVRIPQWIRNDPLYLIECLRGLFQTDGSIYKDRKYLMVNFVSVIPTLAKDVYEGVEKIGFKPNLQKIIERGNNKFTIRISRNSREFIQVLKLWKK